MFEKGVNKKRNLFMLGQNRGQVTVFIIIAVVIIALAALIYFLSSGTKTGTTAVFDAKNPQGFIQTCLEKNIESSIEKVSLQGGSINPESSILYKGNDVEYLCYTSEYYKTCVVQQPLLKQHIESEIQNSIGQDVAGCFNSLKQNYDDGGYSADLKPGTVSVELLPQRVITTMNYVLTATKGETNRYERFNVVLNNNLYELVGIADSIINWEATYGDAETTLYMSYYSDLKVEKHVQLDGSTIYILTDRNNGNEFQFASRSVAWPPGYGLGGIAV